MKRLVMMALAASFLMAAAPPKSDQYTLFVGWGTGLSQSFPLTGPMTIGVAGDIVGSAHSSKPGTFSISGPASCSASGRNPSCSIDAAPAGDDYTVTFTPDGPTNSASILVEYVH